MTPEFSHIVKLSDLGSDDKKITIEADDGQREALAKRFDLPTIKTLSATYTLRPEGDKIGCTGTINARLEQVCSISGESFSAEVEEDFEIIFLPKTKTAKSEEEVELAPEDCDVMEYEDNKIDIGEAIAQTLFLALDPYPRGPNADAAAKKKGLKSEEEAGPFGALAALKDKLG